LEAGTVPELDQLGKPGGEVESDLPHKVSMQRALRKEEGLTEILAEVDCFWHRVD